MWESNPSPIEREYSTLPLKQSDKTKDKYNIMHGPSSLAVTIISKTMSMLQFRNRLNKPHFKMLGQYSQTILHKFN